MAPDVRRTALGIALLVPVLLVAAWLRAHRFRELNVWIDEAFTLRMSEFTWNEMLRRLEQDTHPPLFNILLKLWRIAFGPSITAARLLPLTCGVSAVVAMYLFVSEACRKAGTPAQENFQTATLPALVAATLLALAPMHAFWSLIIRMYSLPTALVLISSCLLLRALRSDRSRFRDWCWYSVSAALLGYSHYFALFTLVSQFLFAAVYRLVRGEGRTIDRLSPVVLSGFGLWLAWQPWLPSFLEQRAHVAGGFYLQGPARELMGNAIHGVWVGPGVPTDWMTGWVIAQVSFLVLLGLLLGGRPGDWLIAAAAIMPVVGAIVTAYLSRPLITAHYLQFAHVFMLAAVAVVACRVPHIGRIACIAFVIGGAGYLSRSHYQWREIASQQPGIRDAVARYDAVRHGGEPLVTCSPFLQSLAQVQSQDSRNAFLFGAPQDYPFYTGTAVIRDQEYVDSQWLLTCDQEYLWTLDGETVFGRVPVPANWRLLAEERYPDWYVTFVLRMYGRNIERPVLESRP